MVAYIAFTLGKALCMADNFPDVLHGCALDTDKILHDFHIIYAIHRQRAKESKIHDLRYFTRIAVFEGQHGAVAFPVLHGDGGEDGSAAGLLGLASIPCVGCDVGSAAMCMDKYYTNCVLDRAGIPRAKWDSFTLDEWRNDQKITERVMKKLGLPVFVKPSNTGSSVGVKCAKNEKELAVAIEMAFTYSSRVVCEEAVDGLEIEVGILGDPPRASVCGQIPGTGHLYGYVSKYFDGTKVIVPAQLPQEKSDEVRAAAVRAFKTLGCKGLARVDFFVRGRDGAVLVNEINTIPGFTPASMYPQLWEATGVPLAEQITLLIEEAIGRERPKYDFPDPMGE